MSAYDDAIATLATTHLDIRRLNRGLRRILPAYCDFTLQEWTWESGGRTPIPSEVATLLSALVEARPDQLVAAGLHADRAEQLQDAALFVLRALSCPPSTPAALAA